MRPSDKYSPVQKIEIVEAYLSDKHERGAVKALCKRFGVSRPLISRWREQIRSAAALIFGDIERTTKLVASDEVLRRRAARLWRENQELDAKCDAQERTIAELRAEISTLRSRPSP